MLKRGILIIATGHPYYGKMAYNLALTIKTVDKTAHVTLCCESSAISHLASDQRSIFDDIKVLPLDMPRRFGTKLHMYDLSPYEETLYLDADMAWLPAQTAFAFFNAFDKVEFTAITEGVYDIETKENKANKKYYYWAEPEAIAEAYGLTTGNIYQWRSEFVFFRRSQKMADFFQTCKEVYNNPRVEKILKYADNIPDELAINIAAAIHDIHPHQFKWTPAYWSNMHGEHIESLEELYGQYYALSCGSNISSSSTKKLYDRIVKVACNKKGIQHLFPLINKRDIMKDRIKM